MTEAERRRFDAALDEAAHRLAVDLSALLAETGHQVGDPVRSSGSRRCWVCGQPRAAA